MPYLQQLWLNHNRLTRLPLGLPASVRRLLVESNSLTAVDPQDAFPVNGSQLVALSVAGNHISTLRRGDLERVRLLRALDVSVNNIRRLDADALADNVRLRSLQLSRNPLSHLSAGCFRRLAALRRLSLSFVPSDEVEVAPHVFDDVPALMALDLDSSPGIARSVMDSESLLTSLAAVKELGLLNTQLTRLPRHLPRHLPSLVVVRLSSTRWHCDASAAAWMRAWMASTGVELVGAGEILCLTPPDLRGRPLLTVADWELDGQLPTVVLPLWTTVRPSQRLTTTGRGRSPLDWPDLSEYVDSMDVELRSAVYDDHVYDDDDDVYDDDDESYDKSYDVLDSRTSSHDFATMRPSDAVQSSTEHAKTQHSLTTGSAPGSGRNVPSTIALF